MFARLFAHLQLRRSTAFLLEREDDHLLKDIGLTREDLRALRSSEQLFERADYALYHAKQTGRDRAA